ncbi:hypothetical protein B9G69_013250 [Bdellovibrio sp. SKB1291214]|uniref:BP74-related protein n=1 Tax=Bdellovibrio sp. SKB1291214 TaxID=1732569 RepID=UPI000B516116|nr:hypothetical protein [Bdellovibrio sp. SKB1291214]UYL08011.1 hypothetical protein B9G69_013250 [Bdellovibrio sp. SKB1291214]
MHKKVKTTFVAGLVLSASIACSKADAAEVFYAPGFCDPKALTVFVQNKSAESEKWWTQVHENGAIKEGYQELDGKSEMKVAGTDFLSDKRGFSLKAGSANALRFTATCDSQKLLLSSTTSPQVTHYLPMGLSSVKLSVLNLYMNSSEVTLKAFDLSGLLIEEKTLHFTKHYETQNLKWNLNRLVARIEASSFQRFHSEIIYGDEEKQSPPLVMNPVRLPADISKKYFLISTKTPSENGSFVIALDDAETIATAREQIRRPELEKIVVARIALNTGPGINRNFQARDKAPYSWNVTDVDAFGDFAHIDCDGNPDLVEERLQQKINEGGRICFWRYRVVRELTPSEVSTGVLNP